MSKYDPLGEFLRGLKVDEIVLTFAKIEKIVGFELPERSSSDYPWWSNNPDNNVMTKVWLDAGWRTKNLRLQDREVTFYRDNTAAPQLRGSEDVMKLSDLSAVSRGVLSVLAKRSNRTVTQEAIAILEDALK